MQPDERRSIIVEGEGLPKVLTICCSRCKKWFRTNATRRVCALCRTNPVYKQTETPVQKRAAKEIGLNKALEDIPDYSLEKGFRAFAKLWN